MHRITDSVGTLKNYHLRSRSRFPIENLLKPVFCWRLAGKITRKRVSKSIHHRCLSWNYRYPFEVFIFIFYRFYQRVPVASVTLCNRRSKFFLVNDFEMDFWKYLNRRNRLSHSQTFCFFHNHYCTLLFNSVLLNFVVIICFRNQWEKKIYKLKTNNRRNSFTMIGLF